MQKKHTTKIFGILILFLLILESGQISMAEAKDLCGNAICEATESCITCATDCSCGNDFEWNCADQVDNDLDKTIDCNDLDCTEDLACVLISNIDAATVKNLPSLQEEQKGKSAAPDEQIDFAAATQDLAAHIPLWMYFTALAVALFMLLMYSRLRLIHFEDQDEW